MLYVGGDMIEALVTSKLLRTSDGSHGCRDCEYTSKHLNCVKIHIESKHLNTGGFDCPECGKNVPTRNALKVHRQRNHTQSIYMTAWGNKVKGLSLHLLFFKTVLVWAPIISHNTWNRRSDLIFLSDDVEAAVWSQIGRSEGGSWTCLVCSYSTHHKTNMFQHVEAKHFQTGGYHCPLCQKFCPNSKSLKNHKSRCPNKSPRIGVWVSPPLGYVGLPLLEKDLLKWTHWFFRLFLFVNFSSTYVFQLKQSPIHCKTENMQIAWSGVNWKWIPAQGCGHAKNALTVTTGRMSWRSMLTLNTCRYPTVAVYA